MSEVRANLVVPAELEPRMDDHFWDVFERHAARTHDELLEFTQYLTDYQTTEKDDTTSSAIIVRTSGKGDPEAGVHVYPYSFAQPGNANWAARVSFYHDLVNPDGVTVALPNNNGKQRYYDLSTQEMKRLENSDMSPFYERQVRTVERLFKATKIGRVSIDGASQGGLVALGMASVSVGNLPIDTVHALDTPSEERTAKKLNADFRKSGGYFILRKAAEHSAIPSLIEERRHDRLILDILRFGLETTRGESKALMSAMATPGINELIASAQANHEGIAIDLTYIDGSKMKGDVAIDSRDRLKVIDIAEGPGSIKHATLDNIVANALVNYS